MFLILDYLEPYRNVNVYSVANIIVRKEKEIWEIKKYINIKFKVPFYIVWFSSRVFISPYSLFSMHLNYWELSIPSEHQEVHNNH